MSVIAIYRCLFVLFVTNNSNARIM